MRTIDPGFIAQLLQPLTQCYKKLDLEDQLERLLKEVAVENSSVVPYLAELIKAKSGSAAAIGFLSDHLAQYPSMEGLVELLGLQMHNVEADVAASLESLLVLINEQVKKALIISVIIVGLRLVACSGCIQAERSGEKIRFRDN